MAIDLQVNGYAGVDFNGDVWTLEQLEAACQRLVDDGVEWILATVITDHLDAMERRLQRLQEARSQSKLIESMLAGFHIEGPFLNEAAGYIGAHPVDAACPANWDAMQRLLEATGGLAKIVTLAPERDEGLAVTRKLADAGVVVSAGHCDPSLDQLKAAIDAGLSMFTHLGNGCPLQMHRHDNIIQRVIHLANHLWIGFIADGVHVPFMALTNYLEAAGLDRCFVVTDAISAAGQGPGTYDLGGQTVVVDESLATWAEDRSHLMGSAGTMPRTRDNLHAIGLDESQVDRLTHGNPLAALS